MELVCVFHFLKADSRDFEALAVFAVQIQLPIYVVDSCYFGTDFIP